jgi:hypothetical protein
VSVSRSVPEAKSHILIVLSALPVQNHSFVRSTAILRTHPVVTQYIHRFQEVSEIIYIYDKKGKKQKKEECVPI